MRISGLWTIVPRNWTFCCMPLLSSSVFFWSQGRRSIESIHGERRFIAVALSTPLMAAKNSSWSTTFIFR